MRVPTCRICAGLTPWSREAKLSHTIIIKIVQPVSKYKKKQSCSYLIFG